MHQFLLFISPQVLTSSLRFSSLFSLCFQTITAVDRFDCFIAVVLITPQQLEYLNVHLRKHYA